MGGRIGTYKVRAIRKDFGSSNSDKRFDFIIAITSIEPNEGSENGGAELIL